MSSGGGPPQRGGSRGKGNDRGKGPGESRARGGRGRGGSDRGADRGGGRGRGRGSSHDLPYRPAQDPGRNGFRGRGGRGGRGGGRGGGHFDQGPPIFTPAGDVPSPSSKITKTENSLVAALTKSKKSIGYPQRPGYGTQGREVHLFANYFELKSVGKSLYRHSIEIDALSAREPAPKKARRIICLLLEEEPFSEFRPSIVTDYRSTMISHLKILDQQQGPVTYDIVYRGEHEDEPPKKVEKYRVTLKFIGQVDPTTLLNYLTSSNAAQMFEEKADILQALNIVAGHYPKSSTSIASVGANKHYAIQAGAAERFNLGAGLEALRGYFASVRAATARILVNVQIKYVACYEDGPLSHVIRQFQLGGKKDTYSLKTFLYQLRVRVTHIERKNRKGKVIPRMKTIINLATSRDGHSLPNPPRVKRWGAGPKEVEFFLDAPGQSSQQTSSKSKKGKKPAGPEPSGSYITVADFFKQNYNIQVDQKMPVVNVGSIEKPSYLPVEVCQVEAGQPAKTKLSPNQTREMLKFAVRSPAQNASSIVTKGMETLGLGDPINATLAKFGIQTNPSLITVPARVLPPPSVHYKDSKSSKDKRIDTIGGSWNMRSIKFSTTSSLSNWTWINITQGNRSHFANQEKFENCLGKFTAKLKEVGVDAKSPLPGTEVGLEHETFEREINDAIGDLMNKHNPELILTILPFNDTKIYNCVKKACDIRHGVRNVNVLAERFKGCNEQYFANVGLKFNLKLGGINQVVKMKQLEIIGQDKTMLLGIDVTHPSPGSAKGAPSVAAMVASIDSSLGQWPAEIRVQKEARNEMVDALDSMLKEHLRRWASSHKDAYPENIIVYRDGVSEGQYDLVTSKELPLLKAACKAIYPAALTANNLPRFSIIIVGKRHHTRFYPTRQEDADRSNNPSHGTVVDRGVTEARNWDFFLQAHTALKGTARPAHYYTVWDEIFLNLKPALPAQNAADILEEMTHHMCYLFGRATKAVSICPPAYYADLVCTRARCYLSRAFEPGTPSGSVIGSEEPGVTVESSEVSIHPKVKDTMFYI